jgi:hypothetical protein
MGLTIFYVAYREGPLVRRERVSVTKTAKEAVFFALASKYHAAKTKKEAEACSQDVWDLVGSPRITHNERIVLASLLPRAVVRRYEMADLASHYRVFDSVTVGEPTELSQQAELLEKVIPDTRVRAGCWCWSHLEENPWWFQTAEDAGRGYNLYRDKGHIYLFDEYDWEQISA